MEKGLCPSCTSLQLGVDKFLIRNSSSSRYQPVTNTQYQSSSSFALTLRSGDDDLLLGSLNQCQRNAVSCVLCKLMSNAVATYSPNSSVDSKCSLKWEIDGRATSRVVYEKMAMRSMPPVNVSRRLRLRWQDGNQKPQDAYLVFLAPEDPLSPNSDASSRRKKETHFLARSIETTKGKKSPIHSWITLCESHGSYCRESAGDKRDFFRMLDQAQFGVIDVITLQVVELPCDQESQTHEKYIALSYVWGKKEVYKTLRSNVLKHLQHGGLEAPLRKELNGIPKTIQDAIQLVKDIGLRYLWVDSLCIVQDSPRSLQINAPMMDLVYGNAHVTICAADGEDSSVGLVAMNTKDPADQLRARIAPESSWQCRDPPKL